MSTNSLSRPRLRVIFAAVIILALVASIVVGLVRDHSDESGNQPEPGSAETGQGNPEPPVRPTELSAEDKTFVERVLQFEEAYHSTSLEAKSAGLEELATPEYREANLKPGDFDGLEGMKDLTIHVNRSESIVTSEEVDGVRFVTATVVLETRRGNEVVNEVAIPDPHSTVWVKDSDGNWRVSG